jgi:hypothetical protein
MKAVLIFLISVVTFSLLSGSVYASDTMPENPNDLLTPGVYDSNQNYSFTLHQQIPTVIQFSPVYNPQANVDQEDSDFYTPSINTAGQSSLLRRLSSPLVYYHEFINKVNSAVQGFFKKVLTSTITTIKNLSLHIFKTPSKRPLPVQTFIPFSQRPNLIIPPPLMPDATGNLNHFANPFSKDIPQKVKEVYNWSPNWNPLNVPDYIQCVTYVAMIYNLNGINLKDQLGNPKEVPYNGNFQTFQDKKSIEPPQKGDIMIWVDGVDGHMAVITSLVEKYTATQEPIHEITVTQANTVSNTYTFYYRVTADKRIEIFDRYGRTNSSPDAWLPDYWLRK